MSKIREAARALGDLEQDIAVAWLLLVNLDKVNPFEANRRIEADYALKRRLAEAEYEIALRSKEEPDAS